MNSEPGPHPEPPSDFHSRTLPITSHGGSLFRSHLHSVAPLYFGRTGRNRFDDPLGRYAVLYAACDPYGAFIETFGQETGNRTVGVGELKMRCLTEFYPVTPLSLVDLFGQGCLARIGADSRLFAGSRAIAQRWSRAIYEHPDRLKVHGILYPARHNHTHSAVALFDHDGLPRITSLTGPVAYAIGLIGICIAGGTLLFGHELGEVGRRACMIGLVVAALIFAAPMLASAFGVGGAVV